MSQITKRTIKTAMVAGVAVAPGMTTVMADETPEVVRTTTSGDGVTNYTSEVAKPSVSNTDVAKVNAAIQNIAAQSQGLVTISGTANSADLETLNQIKELVAKYNDRKATMDTQVSTMKSLSGLSPLEAEKEVIKDSNLATVLSRLKTVVSTMDEAIEYNKEQIETASQNSKTGNRELNDAIANANVELAKKSESVAHANDGVVGNYDDVNRKAHDSAQNTVIKTAEGTTHGLIVDTSATKAINGSVTSTKAPEMIAVSSLAELEAKKKEAFGKIAAAQVKASDINTNIGEYKDNSLLNIDRINKWLQEVQDISDNAQDIIDQNMTANDAMDAYKKAAVEQLNAVKAEIESLQTDADLSAIYEAIDKARAEVDKSVVKQVPANDIPALDNVDFGDIGQKPADIEKKIQDFTGDFETKVNKAVEDLKASNAAAEVEIKKSRDSVGNITAAYKQAAEIYIREYAKYKQDLAAANARNQAIADANRKIMEAKNLKFTNDYATDLASVEKWNAENVGKTGNDTGIRATSSTTFELASKGYTLTEFEQTHAEYWHKKSDGDFKGGNTWAFKTDSPITIRAKNTTKGDVLMTFSNIKAHGLDSYPWSYVSLWTDAGGGLAFGLSTGEGEWGNGGTGGGEGFNGVGGGEGFIFAYIDSYDLQIETSAGDVTKFTFNDNDNGQTVAFKSSDLGNVTRGRNVQRNGNSFTSNSGNVSQGSLGVLGSNSIGLEWDNPRKITLSLTHSNPPGGTMVNIIGGVFGDSAMSKVLPIAIEKPVAVPEQPEGFNGEKFGFKSLATNVEVKTFTIKDPTARAHTSSGVTNNVPLYAFETSNRPTADVVTRVSAEVVLPQLVPQQRPVANPKKASSSNSFVVKQLGDETKRTASGNSMNVRTIESEKRTASGNSMNVRGLDSEKRVSSGNSLVTRVIEAQETTGAPVKKPDFSTVVKTVEKDQSVESTTFQVTAYADATIKESVVTALNKWVAAFASQNVAMNVDVTSDQSVLEKGVTIAFLDADNETTRVPEGARTLTVRDDAEFEMNKYAGLSMTTDNIVLVDLEDDKFNRDASIKKGSQLKNSQYIIQMNSEAIDSSKSQVDVLTHEIGHLFGLEHNDEDSLMTTYYDDEDFTGEISKQDALMAVAYVLSRLK